MSDYAVRYPKYADHIQRVADACAVLGLTFYMTGPADDPVMRLNKQTVAGELTPEKREAIGILKAYVGECGELFDDRAN